MVETASAPVVELDDRREVVRPTPERRQPGRERSILPGTVLFPGGSSGHAVTILNRSKTGAKLKLAFETPLPARFGLLDQRAGIVHDCRVVWRNMPLVGVAFEGSTPLKSKESTTAAQMKGFWQG